MTREQLENYARGTLQGLAASECEEHLEKCSDCQTVLAELFEAGERPDWLDFPVQRDEVTRISPTDESTLRFAQASTTSPTSTPRSPAAHWLWQQQGLTPGESTGLELSVLQIPQAIGRYRIVCVLGSGGFGHVYLARDEKLQRNVALKVPHYAQTNKQVHWDLMLAEAQTVAALDHPGIVPLYDVASTDEVPMFLVSKLIEGQTLAECLSNYSPLAAAELMVQVAAALQYAHEQGVIHRDIKPQNILLDKAGQVYLADFGLAWRTADNARAYPNAGTPFYMSPEQFSGDSQTIDERSDVYSLAKVLQQMLGGFQYLREQSRLHSSLERQRLGLGSSQKSVIEQSPARLTSVNGENLIQPDARWREDVPGELRLICNKATAIEPDQRYQSAAEFAKALQQFVDSQAPIHKRYRWLFVTIASALAASVLFTLLSWYDQSRTVERRAAEQAVVELLAADPSTLVTRANAPELISTWAQPLLRSAASESDPGKRLRARLGLVRTDSKLLPTVAEDLLDSQVEMARAIAPLLVPYEAELVPAMWQTLKTDSRAERRLNAAAYLAIAAEHDEHWQDFALVDKLLHDLVSDSVSDLKPRVDSLLKQREVMLAAVRRTLELNVLSIEPLERLHLNSVWELLVRDDLKASIDLMLCGPPNLYTTILSRLNADDPQTIELLREAVRIGEPLIPDPVMAPLSSLQQRHLAGMALLKLGHDEDYWPLWQSHSNPTHLTLQISLVGFGPLTKDRFIARLRQTNGLKPVHSMPIDLSGHLFRADLSERRNLLLALSASRVKQMIENEPGLVDELKLLYREDADPCVHNVAKQILVRNGTELPELDPSTGNVEHNGKWFVNSLGVVMVIVPSNSTTAHRYAVSDCEVQRQHFELFLSETEHAWTGARLADDSGGTLEDRMQAQVGMSWFDAAAYCNWLSLREGLDVCYQPNAEGKYEAGMSIRPNAMQLNGYRIPTSSEWENAGRGGADGDLYFGDAVFAVREYVWDMAKAHGVPKPVGHLRPNSLGLFDIHGNASEWTVSVDTSADMAFEIRHDTQFEHRGGHILTSRVPGCYFAARETTTAHSQSLPTGLRIVRTIP